MPQEIIDKIMHNISVTSDKDGGSGIGLGQVRSTLEDNKGTMSIKSEIGKGTTITLTFPKAESPDWMTKQIDLYQDDLVIVLDDDTSIHGAWEIRFEPYKSKIKLHHFKLGDDLIEFINNLTSEEKSKLFLLSDFELIDQKLNGLQIIEKLNMQDRSILITSHYGSKDVQDLATKAGVKILPKGLASRVTINIEESENEENKKNIRKKVDLVIIDDDKMLTDSLACFFQNRSLVVDTYYSPKRFLKELPQYAKNTKICMDNNFPASMTGIELAKQLNKAGYTHLYLFTGEGFIENKVPDYLTVIVKGDTDTLNKLL